MSDAQSAYKRFHEAETKVVAAIQRLENAVAQTGEVIAEREAVTEQLSALRADRDRLSTALNTMQQKYADLRGTSETVAGRLDTTIGRVQTMLED